MLKQLQAMIIEERTQGIYLSETTCLLVISKTLVDLKIKLM